MTVALELMHTTPSLSSYIIQHGTISKGSICQSADAHESWSYITHPARHPDTHTKTPTTPRPSIQWLHCGQLIQHKTTPAWHIIISQSVMLAGALQCTSWS